MSVRTRLTLWNVCVLALMLIGLAVALRITLQVLLINAADRSLGDAVGHEQDMAANPPPMPMRPRGQGGPGPPPFHGKGGPGGPFGKYPPQSWDSSGKSYFPWGHSAPYDHTLFTLSLHGGRVFETHRWNGVSVRVVSVPLRYDHHIVGVAQAGYSLTEAEAQVRQLTRLLLLLAAPALIIAGLGGAFLTNHALRPVRRITEAAGKIQAEDLSGRLDVEGKDELSALALTVNGMLGRLEEAFSQREAAYARLAEANARLEQAYAQERRFTADASHELKTPLTVIAGTVSLALSGTRTSEQYRQSLETVGRSTETMTRIIQDLLLLARSDAGGLALNVRPVALAEAIALAQESSLAAVNTPPRIRVDLSPDTLVCAEPDPLVRLFVNLLDNAIRHTPQNGEIRIASSLTDPAFVTVTVVDTGSGIAAEHLPHVTERFYRMDAARSRSHGGTGLGLAICSSIVEAYGGNLRVESVVGKGTTVTVSLPVAAQEATRK